MGYVLRGSVWYGQPPKDSESPVIINKLFKFSLVICKG